MLDNSERRLSELDFLKEGFSVANPVFNLYEKLQGQNLFESNLKKLPVNEKSITMQKIKTTVGENHFSIILRKSKMKESAEKIFKNVRTTAVNLKEQKLEVTLRQLRIMKLFICLDYSMDILSRVYCDAIKLQILRETDTLRKRIYLMPKESIFLEIPSPKYGEHEFAAYCVENQQNH